MKFWDDEKSITLTRCVVVAALMALAVVVAVGVAAVGEGAGEQGVHRRVRAALDAGVELYPCGGERVAGPAADAAADERGDAVRIQEPGQRAVAEAVGGHDLARDDLAVLDLVDLELLRVPEVLEHAAVFIGHCYFHVCYLLSYWLMPII